MIDPATLDRIGNVPTSYVHRRRPTAPCDLLVVPEGVFKWYAVYPVDDPILPDLDADARSHVSALLAGGQATPPYGMGFVVLHHSTGHDFLFVCSWQGHQELWDSIFFRPVGDVGPWIQTPGGVMSPVCCVWEMAPIWHERNAWVTYLESARSVADRAAWIDDTLREGA